MLQDWLLSSCLRRILLAGERSGRRHVDYRHREARSYHDVFRAVLAAHGGSPPDDVIDALVDCTQQQRRSTLDHRRRRRRSSRSQPCRCRRRAAAPRRPPSPRGMAAETSPASDRPTSRTECSVQSIDDHYGKNMTLSPIYRLILDFFFFIEPAILSHLSTDISQLLLAYNTSTTSSYLSLITGVRVVIRRIQNCISEKATRIRHRGYRSDYELSINSRKCPRLALEYFESFVNLSVVGNLSVTEISRKCMSISS